MERTLKGIATSPGIAIGPALIFDVDRCDVPKYAVADQQAELARLNRAVEAAREDLTFLYNRTAEELGSKHAGIFTAHLLILDDVALRDDVAALLDAEAVNVEHILETLLRRYTKVMRAAKDPRFQERTADMLDVVDRVLGYLLEAERPNLKELAQPCIVVSHELSPSDIVTMDMRHAMALALDGGGVTSHMAILARALGLPAVIGLEHASSHVETGALLIVDGGQGVVIIDPGPATLERYRTEKERLDVERLELQRASGSGPCHTSDGVRIETQANIELPIEVDQDLHEISDGIGLYRTEYLFLDRDTLPSEEEQYAAYAHVARAMAPHPVTLRTMDIGGDKFVAHLQISKEDNPQLGWRAVRFCLARPDIFKVQLRAMLRASTEGNVRIMIPMISGVAELRKVKQVLSEVKETLCQEGVAFDEDIRLGCMIEVPSAVVVADLLAKECDFLSVGTNDLIQYSLAVDRLNEKIAYMYEPAHPAILRMLSAVGLHAKLADIPCGICGEMACDPLYTELLLGMGLSSLSMAAISLPVIRTAITQIDLKQAEALAREVLQLDTAEEVKAVLQARYDKQVELSSAGKRR